MYINVPGERGGKVTSVSVAVIFQEKVVCITINQSVVTLKLAFILKLI